MNEQEHQEYSLVPETQTLMLTTLGDFELLQTRNAAFANVIATEEIQS